MRPVAVLLGVLLLVVAGCSGGGDAPAEEAGTTTQASATTQSAAESTISLSSGEEAVDATVVYEPGNCTYLGPAVIPRGTKATFELDDGGHDSFFVVALTIDGITREEIIEYLETQGGPNAGSVVVAPYFVAGPFYYQEGAGLMVVEFRDDGDWHVVCGTPPDSTNRGYLGGMIKVIEG